MRWASIAAISLATALCATTLLHAQGSAPRTIWDGVYTEAQADRGKLVFSESCSKCHGENLDGRDEIPPVKGPHFLANWDGQTVSDLVQRIRATMPLDNPGSMSAANTTDLVAYLVQQNGGKAGAGELSSDTNAQADIKVTATPAQAMLAPTAPTGVRLDAAAETAMPPVNGPIAAYTRDDGFLKLPPGRHMGSSSAVAGDSKGHIWVVDRCGENDCAGSKLDPVMEFDAKGKFIKAFGAGQILFAHGIFIDKRDHIWVTDGHNDGKIGDDVLEYDQNGKILRTFGKPGVAGNDQGTFHEPNAIFIAPDGSIFISDGHSGDTILTNAHGPEMGNSRVMKFDPSGKFLLQWGKHGSGPGEFQTPHCLTMDSAGRLFVGDRSNNRIEIFDQKGKFIAEWSQFGRPSGCYIDKHDVLYVSDSESKEKPGYAHHPGWKRGVRIGSAKTGQVTAFIPDEITDPAVNASGGEGVWADGKGVVYNAEVFQKAIVRYLPPK